MIPRLTSAHNIFRSDNLGVYKLLALLPAQQVTAHLSWNWGALARMPFLPRVTYRNVVLVRRRWRPSADELDGWLAARDEKERCDRIEAWRARWRVPRWTIVNDLCLDLDNPDCVELLPSLVRSTDTQVIEEAHPHPENTAVRGPGGAFLHEFDLPLLNLGATPPPPLSPLVERTLPAIPGGDWLFASLYCGEKSGDEVIAAIYESVVAPCREEGVSDRWFVVRYANPEPHIRLRLRGDPARLRAIALARLHAAAEELLRRGLLWRLQLETYEPEVERYGGPDAFAMCEEWFRHDSDSIVRLLGGPIRQTVDQRERVLLAATSVHDLLGLFGLTARREHEILHIASTYFRSAAPQRADLREHLARQFRAERALLDAMLANRAFDGLPAWVAPLHAEFEARRLLLRPLAERLVGLECTGSLVSAFHDVVIALLHMNVNRLLSEHQTTSEVLIYDLLERLHLARSAREKDAAGR